MEPVKLKFTYDVLKNDLIVEGDDNDLIADLCKNKMVRSMLIAKRYDTGKLTKESYYRDKLCKILKGMTEIVTPVGKIDIKTETEIIEVKNVKNWKHALGQIQAYSKYYPKHTKRIHLYGDATKEKLEVIETSCKKFKVNVSFEPANKINKKDWRFFMILSDAVASNKNELNVLYKYAHERGDIKYGKDNAGVKYISLLGEDDEWSAWFNMSDEEDMRTVHVHMSVYVIKHFAYLFNKIENIESIVTGKEI